MKDILSVLIGGLLGAACLIGINEFVHAEDAKSTVDMTTELKDQDNQPIKDEFERKGASDCSKCPDLTLGSAAAHALFFVGPDEKDVTPEQKWAWSAWAMEIRKNKAVKLTAPESDLLYKRLGKLYGGIVLMRAMPLIDPNRKPPEIK